MSLDGVLMMSLDDVLLKADVVLCTVDGTGGGMIQTPDDHFQRPDRAWNSGLLYANTHTSLYQSNHLCPCSIHVSVFSLFFIVYL